MGLFYRGDIVGDLENNQYLFECDNKDGTVDVVVFDMDSESNGTVLEVDASVLHLISRPLKVRINSWIDKLWRKQ
jgi:hypothetical protein